MLVLGIIICLCADESADQTSRMSRTFQDELRELDKMQNAIIQEVSQ
jgi:hypothetical protein